MQLVKNILLIIALQVAFLSAQAMVAGKTVEASKHKIQSTQSSHSATMFCDCETLGSENCEDETESDSNYLATLPATYNPHAGIYHIVPLAQFKKDLIRSEVRIFLRICKLTI